MTTLTSFLLARIAEDEAGARSGVGCIVDVVDDFVGDWVFGPAQLLAECEAKRLLIERALDPLLAGASEFERGRRTQAGSVLYALALPYADHPDYREEWKP